MLSKPRGYVSKKFLAAALACITTASCASLKNGYEARQPNNNCTRITNLQNHDVKNAIRLFSGTPDGRIVLRNSLYEGVRFCFSDSYSAMNASYNTSSNAVTAGYKTEDAQNDAWEVLVYHEMFHALQKSRAEASEDNGVYVSMSRKKLFLYSEATAYVAQTRFLTERLLEDNKAIILPAGPMRVLYLEMVSAYTSYPDEMTHKEKLDRASLHTFKFFLETDYPDIEALRRFYNTRNEERFGINARRLEKFTEGTVDAYTSLPTGYNLLKQYTREKLVADKTNTASNLKR